MEVIFTIIGLYIALVLLRVLYVIFKRVFIIKPKVNKMRNNLNRILCDYIFKDKNHSIDIYSDTDIIILANICKAYGGEVLLDDEDKPKVYMEVHYPYLAKNYRLVILYNRLNHTTLTLINP